MLTYRFKKTAGQPACDVKVHTVLVEKLFKAISQSSCVVTALSAMTDEKLVRLNERIYLHDPRDWNIYLYAYMVDFFFFGRLVGRMYRTFILLVWDRAYFRNVQRGNSKSREYFLEALPYRLWIVSDPVFLNKTAQRSFQKRQNISLPLPKMSGTIFEWNIHFCLLCKIKSFFAS